jgi:hypothetical protein
VEKDNVLFPVKSKGCFGNIDKAGSIKIPPRFDDAGLFLGNVDRVQSKGKQAISTNPGNTSGSLAMAAMFQQTKRIMDDFKKIFYKMAFWPAPSFILPFPGV